MWSWETSNPFGVIVMVHGAGEHHGRYEWLIEKWRTSGFHVIMGDLPGQGKEAKERGHVDSFDEFIDAVTLWVERAFAYKLPVFLFGHSLGGLVVIRTMMEKRFLVSGVILSSPCLGLSRPPPWWLEAPARIVHRVAPKFKISTKSSVDHKRLTRNQTQLQKDANDPCIIQKVSLRWYFELVRAIQLTCQRVADFPDVPLLVMQAGEDEIVNKHAVYAWFQRLPVKDSEYKEWDHLMHEIFNEPEREDVFRYAKKFVDPHIFM